MTKAEQAVNPNLRRMSDAAGYMYAAAGCLEEAKQTEAAQKLRDECEALINEAIRMVFAAGMENDWLEHFETIDG